MNGDQGRTYGVHGTNKPESIGSYVSNGCVRMLNQDVIELYNTVPVGTKVTIDDGKDDGTPGVKPATGKVQITVPTANVRSKPSMADTVVAKANRGTTFSLTGIHGQWYRIKQSDGQTAYVHDTVAKRATEEPAPTPAGNRLTVTSDLANIREQPAMSAHVRQRVPKGTLLHQTGRSGNWYRIQLKGGRTAYIHDNTVK